MAEQPPSHSTSRFDLHDSVARLDSYSDFGNAKSYEWLRDVALLCFNPPDHDAAEEEIVSAAMVDAADYIAGQPCGCTAAMVEDLDPCARCRVLGRLGNVPVSR